MDALCDIYINIELSHCQLKKMYLLHHDVIHLKGVFAKNERGYRLNVIKKRNYLRMPHTTNKFQNPLKTFSKKIKYYKIKS